MKMLLSVFILCCLVVLIAYLLFGSMEEWMEASLGAGNSLLMYAVLSFCFLASDILLPVPNSLVMILNGKVLGLFYGTVLSTSSGLVSSLLGFYLGKSANPYLSRVFSRPDKEKSNAIFHRFGKMAIAISKALPILSEAVSFVSGTTATSLKNFLVYSFVGHLLVSLVYAYAGRQLHAANPGLVAVTVVALVLLLSWAAHMAFKKKTAPLHT